MPNGPASPSPPACRHPREPDHRGSPETLGQFTLLGTVPVTISANGGSLTFHKASTAPCWRMLFVDHGSGRTPIPSPLPLTLNNSLDVEIVSAADQLALSGPIGGSGGLVLDPANLGTVVLSDNSNSFSGGAVVEGGTLIVNNSAAYPTVRA